MPQSMTRAADEQPATAMTPPSPSPAAVPVSDFDLFISYAHQGDTSSREAVAAVVARLHDELEADFRQRFGRNIEIFFDRENILSFDQWQVRCHRALRSSRFLIVCLSRSYLRSEACQWEWEEWCRHEVEHGLVGQGAASLWFVQMEALDAPEDAELLRQWKGNLLQRFHIECKEWRFDDTATFIEAAAQAELQQLTEHVAQKLRLLTTARAQRGNLPWPNANFVGRKPELARLRSALLEAPASAPLGLHGIGGMGKTALAMAFAYQQAESFPGGCWLLRCEGRDQLLSVFRTLVHDLDLTDKLTEEEKLNDLLAVQRVFEVLRPRGRALFLLDNVDQPALLAPAQWEFLRGEPWAGLLYTTRLAPAEFEHVGSTVRPLNLDQLPEDQAVDLMRRYQPGQTFASPEHEAAAREIVRLLGGLTLAVETAAVYLGQSDARLTASRFAVDARDYVQTLREDLQRGGTEGVMSQLREVTATLRPTLARLDVPARTVLQLAALMGPDAVALPWLRAIAGLRHPELAAEAAVGQSDPWTQLIRTLIGMRVFLPTQEPRVVTLHRVLHRVLEAELREDRAQWEKQLKAHVRERDAVLEKTTRWEAARWELEPLEALALHWAETAHPEAAALLNQAALRWHGLAEWSRAEPLVRRALAINEASFGPEHPGVARNLNNLAVLLQATNRLAEAEPLYRRALGIWETSLGKEHPEVATALNNLAQLLQATNRLAEAEPLYRRALGIVEASFGPEHPEVAIGLNNLARLLQATNHLAEAEPLYRRALGINEASYGPEHPNVASSLANLGQLLQATNRLAEAEPLYRRALGIDEASFGPEHPKVAIDLNILATLLQATHRLAEAEPLYRRALGIDEASFGPEHPDVARDLNNLALLLKATHRLAEAEPLYRRALGIWETSLGKEHPEVATALNNLATLLQATHRLVEAEPLYRRALAIDEASFGPEHPEVATDLNSLASLLQATHRLVEAEPLTRRMLEIFLKFTVSTGHPHLHLQAAVGNYAGLLKAMKLPPDEVRRRLNELLGRYGMSLG